MEKQPTLRPSDVAVALRLAHAPGARYEDLARGLRLGLAEVHRGVRRLQQAGLVLPGERRVNRQALLEFLAHGVRYAFPPVLGPETRGIPTAAGAPPLAGKLPSSPAVVWPSTEGRSRGGSLLPLYEAAPQAALHDDYLYRALALVDALRMGQARERRLAQELLSDELSEASK
jgi:DNA-binding Lrp family transcriptional regulator